VLDAGSGGNGVYVIKLLTNDGRVLDGPSIAPPARSWACAAAVEQVDG